MNCLLTTSFNRMSGSKRTWNGEKKPQPIYSEGREATPQKTTKAEARKWGLCFNCGIPGHLSKDCRKPRPFGRSSVTCYNCGKMRHIRKDCHAPGGGSHWAPTQGQVGQCNLGTFTLEETKVDKKGPCQTKGILTLYNNQIRALRECSWASYFY